jgi:hypothetical protein
MTQVCWVGSRSPEPLNPTQQFSTNRSNMTKQDLQNAIQFLEKMVIGVADQDRFFATLEALKTELNKRSKPK